MRQEGRYPQPYAWGNVPVGAGGGLFQLPVQIKGRPPGIDTGPQVLAKYGLTALRFAYADIAGIVSGIPTTRGRAPGCMPRRNRPPSQERTDGRRGGVEDPTPAEQFWALPAYSLAQQGFSIIATSHFKTRRLEYDNAMSCRANWEGSPWRGGTGPRNHGKPFVAIFPTPRLRPEVDARGGCSALR